MSPDTPETDTPEANAASWPWSALGLPKMPPDARDIRRAYAQALKQIDQARDPEGFATLRHAYDAALSIREGRSQRNAQARARKAAKVAAITPAAEDIPKTAPPPVDTAQQAAEAAHAAAIEALITQLLDDDRAEPAYKRILTALAAPLGQSPEVEPLLRNACARLIRKHQRPDFNGNFTLSPQITEEALLALDARFGWLNDFIAFRQDFGYDTALQHELATRAYGNFQMAQTLAAKPQGRLAAIFSNGAVRMFSVVILMKLAGWLFDLVKGTPYETTVIALAVIWADVALMAWIYSAQCKRLPAKRAALIAVWYGLALPVFILSPPTDAALIDRPLAIGWLSLTASFWIFRKLAPSIHNLGLRHPAFVRGYVAALLYFALLAPPTALFMLFADTLPDLLIVLLATSGVIVLTLGLIGLVWRANLWLRQFSKRSD